MSDAFAAEVERLEVICIKNLSFDSDQIRISANKLLNLINGESFSEDEQWCRAALVLEAFFLDTLNDYETGCAIHRGLEKKIKKHKDSIIFNKFYAIENRKAAMFYASSIAAIYTESSLDFFINCHDNTNLYLSANNNATNYIRSSNYIKAEESLMLCKNVLKEVKQKEALLEYKVKNNELVLEFLKAELLTEQYESNLSFFLKTVEELAQSFKIELYKAKDNDSILILSFNYLSMLLINFSDNRVQIQQLLKRLFDLLEDNEDAFYTYYFGNACFAYYFLTENFDMAQQSLDKIKVIECPLFNPHKKIFRKRLSTMESLLKTSSRLSPLEFNRYFQNCMQHVSDSSWHFWGRGFLISDIDFWWL